MYPEHANTILLNTQNAYQPDSLPKILLQHFYKVVGGGGELERNILNEWLLVLSLGLLAIVPFLILDVDSQSSSLLTIPPPTGFANLHSDISIRSNTSNTTGYTFDSFTSSPNVPIAVAHKNSPTSSEVTAVIYFDHPVQILDNPIFKNFNDEMTSCVAGVISLNSISTVYVPGFDPPDNIEPKTKSSLVGLGLDFYNSSVQIPCSPNLETPSTNPLITSKELLIAIHEKSDKSPYYFSPRDNILEAQPIPACTTSIYNTSARTLTGENTTMCYGINGTDMIIITKRLAGFYGAADNVTTPDNPLDLNSGEMMTDPSAGTSRDNVKGLDGTLPAFDITTTSAGTATIDTFGKYTFDLSGTAKGHIYIPPDTTISNDLFVAGDAGKACIKGTVMPSHFNSSLSGIPIDVSNGTAYGFVYLDDNRANTKNCILRAANVIVPLDVDNTLQVVLYDQSGKEGYSYLRTANITTAQDVPACNTTNFDNATKTLRDDNKHCYANDGNDLVVYTKVMQWYGARNPGDTGVLNDPTSRSNVHGIGQPKYFGIETTGAGTASIDAFGKYSYSPLNTTPKGHILIPPDTTISNDIFVVGDIGKTCIQGAVVSSEYSSPLYSIPSDVPEGMTYGFRYLNDSVANTHNCMLRNTHVTTQLDVDNTLQVVLYDQSGKEGYSYLRTANITTAQDVPACNTTNFDNATKTLRDDNKHCYANAGNDLVVYTKVMQFYGATVTIDPQLQIQLIHPLPAGTIKIPPPSDFPSGEPGSDHIRLVGLSQDDDQQIAKYEPHAFPDPGDGTIKRVATAAPRVGEVFVPGQITLLTNPLYPSVNLSFGCPDIFITNLTNSVTIPNIQPTSPVGLGFVFQYDLSNFCQTLYNLISDYPVFVDKELRFTLYNKYDKKPYYISPRDNMTQAQPITACSSTNFDTNNQILKGDTKMCYGVNGTNMVIITKRFGGFYGAADTVTDPTNPLDLDSTSPSTAVTTSRQDVSNVNSIDTFNITSGFLGRVHTASALLDTDGKHTFAAAGTTQKGHIYISPSTMILVHPNSNPFSSTSDSSKDCVRGHVISTAHADYDLPDDISEGVAYGFAYTNGSDTCNYNSNSMARQFNVNTPFRIVLYDQAGKQAYSYLSAANITTSQNITKCSSTNSDDATKIPLGSTKQCYENIGNDLVIYSEVMQWYGAKTPSTSATTASITPTLSSSLLTLKPLPNEPEPRDQDTSIAANPTRSDYWYTTARPNKTHAVVPITDSIGHIFIPGPRLPILQNPLLPTTFPEPALVCAGSIHSVKLIIAGDYTGRGIDVRGLTTPNNIAENNDTIIAMGINWYPSIDSDRRKCGIDLEAPSEYPIITKNEQRITLYNQSDKKAYHFSPRENILAAQPIPPCDNDNFDITDQTLKGDTKMCYGKHEKNMVIITKKLTGFYGATTSITVTGTGDDDGDMANAPTFGTSPLTGEQLVTCGYKMDDTCRDITAYHVQYERDVIQTNTTHTFALKALAPNMIDSFILAFGVPEIGSPVSAAEAYITAKLAVNYTSPSYYNIIDVLVHDPNNIIDYNITNTEVSRVSCSGGTLECSQVTFSDVLFRETLYHEPFVVMITDTLLYTSINYMNEGILVTGTPLNEQPTISPGITVDTGDTRPTKLVLVRTDKVNDLWEDAFGNTWSRNSFGNYVIVQYAPYAGTVPVCDDINDRLCAPFKAKLDWHNQRMIELRDSLYAAYTTKEYAEIDNIFTYEFGDTDTRTRTLTNLGWLT